VDASALEHLLRGEATISPGRGIFLPETWRLNPEICGFTSEVYYESRLRSRKGLERQVVRGAGRLAGQGLRVLEVPHTGNQSESPEEVEAIAALVTDTLARDSTWIDECAIEHPLRLEDILIVAP